MDQIEASARALCDALTTYAALEQHDVEEMVNKNQAVKRKANKRVAAAQQRGHRRANRDQRNVD